MTATGKDVRYIRSTFVPGEARCMCLFESSTPAHVEELQAKAVVMGHFSGRPVPSRRGTDRPVVPFRCDRAIRRRAARDATHGRGDRPGAA